MAQTTTVRSWDWKPSAFANAMVAILLRIPILHRVISNQILLLTFSGRKSGKHYTIPVGYVRDGQTVTILTKWFRGWWRNFQGTAPVEVLIARRRYQATAKALTDEAMTITVLTNIIKKYPYYANFYGIRLTAANEADMDDVRRVAPKVVVLQIALTE
jgi:deazaflavin-dependent oxidoreductase (nitroreductase family)